MGMLSSVTFILIIRKIPPKSPSFVVVDLAVFRFGFCFKLYNFPGGTGSVQESQDRFLLQRKR